MKRNVDVSLLPEDITLSQLQAVARAFGLKLEVELLIDTADVEIDLTEPEPPKTWYECGACGFTDDQGMRPCPRCAPEPAPPLPEPEPVEDVPVEARDSTPDAPSGGLAPLTPASTGPKQPGRFGKTREHLEGDYVLCRNPECRKELVQTPTGRKKLYCDGRCKSLWGVITGNKNKKRPASDPATDVPVPEVLPTLELPAPEVVASPSPAPEPTELTLPNPLLRPMQHDFTPPKKGSADACHLCSLPKARHQDYIDGLVAKASRRQELAKARKEVHTEPVCPRCQEPGHRVLECPQPYVKPAKRNGRLQGGEVAKVTEGGTVTVEQLTPDEREARRREREEQPVRVEPTEDGGPTDEEIGASASRYTELWRSGLPARIGWEYLPDVLALYGMDEAMVASCLTAPERVEVRPESYDKIKRYPVLGFYKGDASVILGLRNPAMPCVIAVYLTSKLEADTHRVEYTGGGGAKGSKGLPKTPTQLVSRLRGRGCTVDSDVSHSAAEVTYDGQSLGKINIGITATRETVQSDYQRCIRRIEAMVRV